MPVVLGAFAGLWTWFLNAVLPLLVFLAVLSVTASLFLGAGAAALIAKAWVTALGLVLSLIKALAVAVVKLISR